MGQLCAASYFDTLDTAGNRAFKTRLAHWKGEERKVSCVFASAYTAVSLCIAAIEAAASDEPGAVRNSLLARSWPTLFGDMRIDPSTNHAALPFLLGRINTERNYDVIATAPPIAADPYLTGTAKAMQPKLRVVS